VEGSDLLDVHALPLSGLAGASGQLPGARRLFVLPARMFLLRVVLRLHLFMRLLHLPSDEHRPVVQVLDRSAVPGVADRAATVAALLGGGEHHLAADPSGGLLFAGCGCGARLDPAAGGLR